MTRLRVGFIGTGRRKERRDAFGYAMAYEHADGYRALPEQCELVACADLVYDYASAFANTNGIPEEGIYTDYKKMLAEAKPDVVSICTWPHLHAQMVLDCALAGVKAIHCEKPMSDNWGMARLMEQECSRHGVRLTFNHQRRFGQPFRKAHDLLQGGSIGELRRIEIACGNIYDWGTHYLDMAGLYCGEQAAEWVIGQIDYRKESRVFGAHVENQAIATWRYRNGVFGLISTGPGTELIGADIRLLGSSGSIEIGNWPDNRHLRVTSQGRHDWEYIDTGEDNLHGPHYVERAIANIVEAIVNDQTSELCARNALNATEIIFGIYESSRRRGRVDLPLTISDHPMYALIESGEIHPEPTA
ncbi:Gfo/Idh/MocA family protein [Dictyobacter aurantiacus]|uniref:Oxidoreductase n=1 Tax=Dictyobacter aurantiacus TaxID=1936993 RepID=A0A401ZKZ3_9CHLR|nr:Gfo/Idh/MocA family oxidoreductase [Dictyobacter aurantiacus]GCE07547.1 oxidoreductase [Dictyobacter aurantiacus]